MGIFTKKKKKLNKAESGGSNQTTPSTTEETCGAPSRTYSPAQLPKTASKNIVIPSRSSLLSTKLGHSETLEIIIDNVELESTCSRRDPDLSPPDYTVPESPPRAQKSATERVSPPSCLRIPNPTEASKTAVRVESARSKPSVQSESPMKPPRSKSPVNSLRSYSPKSPRSESPVKLPRSGSPVKSLRSEYPPKSPRSESPGKCPGSRCPAKSPKSGSPVKLHRSECPAEASNSRNMVWPTRAGVARKGGNLDAVFCCGEKVFGADEDARLPTSSSGVSVPSGGPEQTRSEETLLSATEKSHQGYQSDTSQTTIMCSEVCGDDEYDESSCDECESETMACQVQCCCINCSPPSDTCNFFRLPPLLPCQRNIQQNGPWCGYCGDPSRPARTVGNDCCCRQVEISSCCCRPKSRELRGSMLIMGCHCNRKNGLQDDCPRTGCQGSPQCSTQPHPSCDNQQFSQGKHLEEKWEKKQKTEMKVYYCSSYRSAFGPRIRCGPSCTIKVTKEETKTTKQEIRREDPQSTMTLDAAQCCFDGDDNHCPDGCTNWCTCDLRLNQNLTCYTPSRVVPNIPQLSSGFVIPCVNPTIGIPFHTSNCEPDNGGCR